MAARFLSHYFGRRAGTKPLRILHIWDQMIRGVLFIVLALPFLGIVVCDMSGLAHTADSKPQSVQGSNNGRQEALDPRLVTQLCSQQEVCKLFAWSSVGGGKLQIIGVRNDAELVRIIVSRVNGAYTIDSTEPVYRAWKKDNKGIRGIASHIISESGSLKLEKFLPETEIAFASTIVEQRDCRVHFILVWRALSRTSGVSYDSTGIDMRTITEIGSRVVANRGENLSCVSAEAAYPQDVDGDGHPEFVFIGVDNSEHLYIWKINEDCSPEKIAFEDEDGEISDEATGKGVSLKTAGKRIIRCTYQDVRTSGYRGEEWVVGN